MSSTDPTPRRTERRPGAKPVGETRGPLAVAQPARQAAEDPVQPGVIVGSESFDMPGARGYSDAEWHAMVAQAAYLRAERRGFTDGSPEQDWLDAEEELRRTLRSPGA